MGSKAGATRLPPAELVDHIAENLEFAQRGAERSQL